MDYLDKYNAGASEGAVLEILGPDGKPVTHPESGPLTITLLSRDHPDVRAIWKDRLNAVLKAQGSKREIDGEDADLDVLVAATVAWTVHDTPCTKPNVKELYRKHIWIREQVERFYTERANFLPASSNGS